jgi:two-component system, OmpR family, KDP operon response regulator KdpE
MKERTGKTSVLAIDDEPQIRKLLKMTLEAHDYVVLEAATGAEGLVMAATRSPDLVILDMNLPDMPGLEVLKRLREWYSRPVMVVSVVNEEETIVGALDSGADDYLTKPFSVPELLARLRVCLRHGLTGEPEDTFKSGPLAIDFVKRVVMVADKEVHLTAIEFNLLKLFARNAGKVITHRQILKEVWGPNAVEDVQYLRVYMGHLRQKLEPDPSRPLLLITEPGVGYRLIQRTDE